MSFADIAACADAQRKLLEDAGAHDVARAAFVALADLARIFHGQTAKAAEKLWTDLSGDLDGESGRGADRARHAAAAAVDLLDVLAPLKPKASFTAALELIGRIAETHPNLSVSTLADRVAQGRKDAAAKKAARANVASASPAQIREWVDAYARRFQDGRRNSASLRPTLAEMKARKPKLPSAVWIGVANTVIRQDARRTEASSKKALEDMIRTAEMGERGAASVDRAYAMGGR